MDNPKNSLEFLLGEMNRHLESIDEHLHTLNGEVADQRRNIVSLTSFKDEHVGRSSAFGFIGGVIGVVLTYLIKRFTHL